MRRQLARVHYDAAATRAAARLGRLAARKLSRRRRNWKPATYSDCRRRYKLSAAMQIAFARANIDARARREVREVNWPPPEAAPLYVPQILYHVTLSARNLTRCAR